MDDCGTSFLPYRPCRVSVMRGTSGKQLGLRMDDDEATTTSRPHRFRRARRSPARIRAETAIVGGGLAGLATALSLAERGRTAVLIEARTIGAGASGRNGGMVSAGFAAPTRLLERAAGP